MTPQHIIARRCTLSISARCPKTGALGLAVASGSVAIGSRCPHLIPQLGVISTQGFTNPRLAPLALDLLRHALSPSEVIASLRQYDRWIDFRQISILAADGALAVHTGPRVAPWCGQWSGPGLIVMGNGLADGGPLSAMEVAYAAGAALPLHRRLLGAIERGKSIACGRNGLQSAALLCCGPEQRTRIDLRVDLAEVDAVAELRRAAERYAPLVSYYETWPDNPAIGDWWDWQGPPTPNTTTQKPKPTGDKA